MDDGNDVKPLDVDVFDRAQEMLIRAARAADDAKMPGCEAFARQVGQWIIARDAARRYLESRESSLKLANERAERMEKELAYASAFIDELACLGAPIEEARAALAGLPVEGWGE